MTDYSTRDPCKLPGQWKGQKRDESNPEQNRACEDLKKAYEVSEAWADTVRDALFPMGHAAQSASPPSTTLRV